MRIVNHYTNACIFKVHSPASGLLGTVEQDWTIIFPEFTLKDAAENPIMKIKGPFCTWSCCGSDVEFKVSGYTVLKLN